MLIDTHCHLNFSAYKDDIDEVVQRTRDAGMRVINVGSQLSTSQRATEMAAAHPGFMYAAVGLHPVHLFEMEIDDAEVQFHSRQEDFSSETYEQLALRSGVVAIGEMGIDYFHVPVNVDRKHFEEKQQWTFLRGVLLAKKLNKPVIIHCRGEKANPENAYKDVLKILKQADYHNAVLHCFTETWEIAEKFVKAGCMVSFTGIITYPKTHRLAEAVKKVPLDRLMVETDSPYLAPQFVRGQRNEPRFVQYVADRVAEIKGMPIEQVAEATTKNAERFFKL